MFVWSMTRESVLGRDLISFSDGNIIGIYIISSLVYIPCLSIESHGMGSLQSLMMRQWDL